MKTVAIYLLAALGGNAAPSADDLKKIAGSGATGGPCSGMQRRACRGGAPGRRLLELNSAFIATGSSRSRARLSGVPFTRPCTCCSLPPPCCCHRLAAHARNRPPSAPLLSAVGIELDAERVSKLLSELEGKDINEVGAQPRFSCSSTADVVSCCLSCTLARPGQAGHH